MKKYDVCIIGGGAAGLAAAASLSKGIKTCLIEKNDILGRKIMATGGGRCNITNGACRNKDLVLDFFRNLGLETYHDDEGRFFPYSNKAADVVKILTDALESNDVDIITSSSVTCVERRESCFSVKYGKGNEIMSDNVILALGGKAAPQFGTTGDGYSIAKALGHKVERVYPILSAVECGDFKELKGIRARGRVSLYRDNVVIDSELGEIQFTEDGISGICVFNLTPYIKTEEGESIKEGIRRFSIGLDLAPDFTKESLAERRGTFGILTDKLAKRVSLDCIKDWRLPIIGVKGWRYAQCTAGGVSIGEIDMTTMESKLISGVYFAGEILDIQEKCGGYNLQNAWETGIKAARSLNGKSKINGKPK